MGYAVAAKHSCSSRSIRQTIDEIPTLAWSCRPDGTGEFVNKQWLDYTGLSMEEGLGWQWKSVVHPDDLEQLMETWQGHLASGEPGEVEARLRRADGKLVPVPRCADAERTKQCRPMV